MPNPKLTTEELQELKYHYVDSQSETEFIDDCINYWEDHFDDVVNEVKDYANSKFKKPMEDRLNEQKTL